MPRNIKLFQALMYVSIGVGVILRLISGEIDSAAMSIALLLNAGFLTGIVMLIATYRQNWPRWAFAALFSIQFLFSLPEVFLALTSVPGIIALLPMVLRGAALICVFTGDAEGWFERPRNAVA